MHIFQKMRNTESASTGMNADVLARSARWLCVGLILLLIIVIRVRLADVPLERDEGEYAYMGQLLLQGTPPYSDAYNMKFPGTYLMYALIMSLFGQTTQGIHIGLLVLNCITVIVVYLLGQRLINDIAAIAAAGAYGILSLGPSVLGFAAHATHFVALFAVAGALLLHHALEKNKPAWYLFSGAAFGLALIMKQPGFFFIPFGASCILYQHLISGPERSSRKYIRHLALFLFAAVAPLIVSMLWLFAAGVFDTFWFWTVQYAAKYGSQVPLSQAFSIFGNNVIDVIDGFYLLWIISGLGFLVLLFHREMNKRRVFIALFAVFSFLSICPGFYFREHYFITLLPAIALSAGIFVDYLAAAGAAYAPLSWSRLAGFGLFLAVILVGVVHQKEYLFTDDPVTVSRAVYGSNPFPESVEIARFVEQRSSPADKIAVFGSEPQIYFYSKRASATGYIYTYSLFEDHEYRSAMQQEMTREIESANPKFIIVVNVFTSWLIQPKSEMYLFSWLRDYLKKGYTLVGVADIPPSGMTVYKWYDDAINHTIGSMNFLLVFERTV
jgi:4-amino-4-deoxy-L-arabinose transferase-like glycosyltransferase